MLDFLTGLRFQQLFGQNPQQPTFPGSVDVMGMPEMATDTEPPPYDVSSRMGELYHPQTQSIDRFNNLIGQYPQYKEPGKLRKIGGSVLGALTDLGTNFGGTRTGIKGTDVTNEFTGKNKFTEDVENWQNQIKPVEQAANIERQSNSNERTMAYQTVAQELKQQAQDAKDKNDQRKLDIAEKRASVYEFKAKNPNLKLIIPKGGNIMAINPVTGQQMDTGIDSGTLTDADRISLQNEGAIEKVQESGKQARETEETKQGNRTELQQMKGWTIGNITDPNDPSKQISVRINQDTGEVQPIKLGDKPISTVNKPGTQNNRASELPSQTRVRQFNAARELYNTRPELRKYIAIGAPGSNDFKITPPGKNMLGYATGPTAEQYAQIQAAIYGPAANINPQLMSSHAQPTNVPPPTKSNTTGRNGGPSTPQSMGPDTMSKQVRNKTTNEIITVYSTDGGKTWHRQ